MKVKRSYKLKKFTKKQFLLAILLFILLVPITVSLGRYVYKEIKNYYLYSQNFYFNSDKLKENIARYQIDNWSGVDDFITTINLNSSKNNKVFSTSDIDYNVTYRCSDNIICQITKTSGTIYATSNKDNFQLIITPRITLNEGDSIWAEVYAHATSPYTKTLSARFVINIGIPGLSYEIKDTANSPYFDLSITNTLDFYKVKTAFDNYSVGDKIDIDTYMALSDTNKANCASAIIKLTFSPEVVRLDMTNTNYLNRLSQNTTTLDNFDYINEMSFKVDAISSTEVRFYKINASLDYTYPIKNETSIITVTYDL